MKDQTFAGTPLGPEWAPLDLRDDTDDLHFVPAPCQIACPIGTDAPSYIGLIWEGRHEEAFEAITATNPFSSVCGRVCDAPCEPACRRADSDGPLGIRNLKRFVMDRLGTSIHLPPVEPSQDKSVGIVGSGPAGLTAAQDLALAGYRVDVYEKFDRPGGVMQWGIPGFRLPARVLDEDIERILKRCPGITIHMNMALGERVSLDELKQRHDAVLLAIGAAWGKPMGVPGEDHELVEDGVGFLRRINASGERPTLPETVLVIGGGDVAMDACRVAKRLPGCKNVKVVYRRGPEEIPARRDELEGAIKEDIEFVYHAQPVEIVESGSGLALRCVQTELGEPEADGRRAFRTVPGSEHDIECGMIIAAVGQTGDCGELREKGLIEIDRVVTDFESMRTADPQVFGAGDGAFGGSTIVMAMHHGHKAAYYIKQFLEGNRSPLPYRTPYRTRRVEVAQDIMWEKYPRQEQTFHGLGDRPAEFPEIESDYDPDIAIAEAARCFRCDAETGTADYSVRNREDIFLMARMQPENAAAQAAMLQKRLQPREILIAPDKPATFDDIVFLPANLSRLVIDPYREACRTDSRLGGAIALEYPYIVAGFDGAPDEIRAAVAKAVENKGCAWLGRRPPEGAAPWLQLLSPGDTPDGSAAAAIYEIGDSLPDFAPQRARDGQILGLSARGPALGQAIPFSLEKGLEILVLDGAAESELAGPPDLTAIRDAIRILRELNSEEEIDLVWSGGVRSGTDVAKALALGGVAATVGVAMAIAAGGAIVDGAVSYAGDRSLEERITGAEYLLQSMAAETSIMARCTGKTNIHNLEPEDLKSITLAAAQATGIPLAGTR